MKPWWKTCLCLAAALAFFLTGCGSRQEEPAGTQLVSGPDKVMQASLAPAAQPSQPTPIKRVTGRVLEAAMSSLTLRSEEDGKEYSFDTGDAHMELKGSGLAPAQVVEVTYTDSADGAPAAKSVALIEEAPALPLILYEDAAREMAGRMTLEEKIGQMFFARCPAEGAAQAAQTYHIGGYILFDRDFHDKTPDEVRADIAACQASSAIPMLIGVDEEGGAVKRVSSYPAFRDEPFRSPQALYEEGGLPLIRSDTREKAELLLSLGINVNLAPVCDVSTDPEDFIYARAFGQEAPQTSQYVAEVVRQMNESGIGCTLKHFPGYGSNMDTHTGIAHDARPYEQFESVDFLPFRAGVSEGAGSVLVCHNIVECMDAALPASLSPEVHRVLREQIGFEGVIMTDDLYMDAIRDEYGTGEAAVLAIRAGNDLLISSEMEEQWQAVADAVQSGEISEDRIDESVTRILCWKLLLGLGEESGTE